ncbi:MAG: hypothetical protein Fur003_4930 [Candidatus Dojkabacteria bacterium]
MQKFKQMFSPQLARKLFYFTTLVGVIYHILILTQVVDYHYAWGGRLTNLTQMYQFEAVSLVSMVPFLLVVYFNSKLPSQKTLFKVTKYLLFIISGVFLLNTIGNVFAKTAFEAWVFTPITFIASLSTFRLALQG